jgi:hypothetical protein
MSIKAMKQALECLERVLSHGSAVQMAKDVLRQAIEQAEQRADAHLFYAQGDVLICKESNEKAVVMYGNTGLRQLVNGKIELAWSDEVYGEYTLEQIMDGFIREAQPEQAQPVARLERTAEGLAFTPLHVNGVPDGALLYTSPSQRQTLTDDQCDAIATALDDWALNADSYDYGLPIHNEGQLEKARAIIRAAHGIKEDT